MVASSTVSANADGGGTAPTEDEASKRSDQLSEDALFARLKQWVKGDEDKAKKWRKQANEAYDYVAGHQWTAEDREYLREEMRPVITFNRLEPIVDTICGLEINNREEISVKPRSKGDEAMAECATDLLEWVRDEADVEDEESDAFRDVVISGMAWLEHDLIEIDEKKLVNRRVDNFEMRWDGNSKRRNLEDAKHVERIRDIAIDDARAMFPGKTDLELDAGWARGGDDKDEPGDRNIGHGYEGADATEDGPKRGLVTVVEVQWTEVVKIATVTSPPMDPMGEPEVMELPEDEALELVERSMTMGKSVELGQSKIKSTIKRAYLGSKLLEAEDLPTQGEGYTYKALTGKWDRKDGVFYGIIRGAKEPQEWANKFLSETQHILNTTSRNGWNAEEGIFVDQKKAEDDLNTPGSLVMFQAGGLQNGGFQPRQSSQGLPTGFENSLTFALQSIRDATGVNLELSGLADRAQAGVLETTRKQAGVTILAVFFDNLRRYRKASGRMTLKMALEELPPEQLIRAVGEEHGRPTPASEGQPQKPSALEQLMAPGAQQYDVIVEEAPTSANAKERAWAAVQPLVPILIDRASPIILAEIVRMSPIDSQTAEKIAMELLKPPEPEEEQKQAEMEQLAKAGAETKIQETSASAMQKQSQAELNRAKIGETQAKAQEAELKGVAAVIEAQTPDVHVLSPPKQPSRRELGCLIRTKPRRLSVRKRLPPSARSVRPNVKPSARSVRPSARRRACRRSLMMRKRKSRHSCRPSSSE